jgi:lipopolysaccharide transport system ATP-binding protein
MPEPRVSVERLSKIFARHVATRGKGGISTEGPAALRQLVSRVFSRDELVKTPQPGDKRYLAALDGVSLDVAPGEVLGIIGRNGAGKSTLLKILARVLHPTSGRITLRGRVVSMLELGIGFAPELTVRQNIQIHGRLAGVPGRRVRAAEEEILAFAGLTGFADQALGSCPSGSSVQLGFAAVICLGTEILLADEVLAIGDSEFRRACEQRVKAAGASGESVLFVSHDMAAIRRICTRVIWIDRGRIVRDGATEDVVHAYSAELLAGRLREPLTTEGLASSCVLLDARLLDKDHEQVGAMQLTEPGYVDCLFRLSRPDVVVLVDVELWQGKHWVFTTTSQPITTREEGTFRAGIRLPADLFNELPYQARVRLRVGAMGTASPDMVVAAEEHLDFQAMNPHPERSVWNDWSWNRGGLLSPRLQWRLETRA